MVAAMSAISIFDFAPHIQRTRGQAVERTAFQNPDNSLIAGLIALDRQFLGSTGRFYVRTKSDRNARGAIHQRLNL